MPAGRPSKYDPAYCEQAVEFLGKGHTITALAGSLGVHRDTIYAWAKEYSDFSDALARGEAARAKVWEGFALDAARNGNAAVINFGLKNLIKDEWRDKVETEVSGNLKVSGIEVQFVGPDGKG